MSGRHSLDGRLDPGVRIEYPEIMSTTEWQRRLLQLGVQVGALLWVVGCGSGRITGGDAAAPADGPGVRDGTGGADARVAASDGGPTASDGGPATSGIAAAYPGDHGIQGHPSVIFADDFESYSSADGLWQRWDNVFQMSQTRIASESGDVFAGAQSLEFTLPQQTTELSNAVNKILTNTVDVLYLRYYAKFDGTFDIVGSSHNGSEISAGYFINGTQATPGIPADGTNKFLICYECWRGEAAAPNPGDLNIYIYRPGQRSQWGDHLFPDGLVLPNTSQLEDWGPTFVARPNVVPELARWYSYEVMLKANTPGQRDGQVTTWLDGVVVADLPNLRLRDIDTLKIDHFSVGFHAGSNPNGATKKWYDNVVAATEYIGPMAPL